jgi:hypothetical protein
MNISSISFLVSKNGMGMIRPVILDILGAID